METPDKYEKIPRTGWKDLDRAGKIQYVKDYYSLHILIGVIVLIFAVWAVVYYGFTRQTASLYVLTVNVTATTEEEMQLEQDLASYLELNKRQCVIWDDSSKGASEEYNLYIKLTTLLGAGVVDALVFSDNDLESLQQWGAFLDLREVLDEELLARLEADGRLVTGLTPEEEDGGARYPYAMAVDLTGCKNAQAYGLKPLYGGEHLYLGAAARPEHSESIADLILFFLGR